jgi:maltokinase
VTQTPSARPPNPGNPSQPSAEPATSSTPALPHLERYLGTARWFGGKGREHRVERVRRVGVLPAGPDEPRVAIDLVTVAYADGDTELYQFPLLFSREPQDRLAHALVGEWEDPDLGPSQVYDAVHDRDAMALWLAAFDKEGHHEGDHSHALFFHRLEGHEIDLTTHSTLFSGEQSNSSVAFGEDSLMKVFRKVTPGVNPDIQIHEVLTRAGSDHVAALYGWLDTYDEETDTVIQLAMLQQFLRTGTDGWDLAQVSARNLFAEGDLHPHEVGGDFAAEASRLGVALAETHQVLAEHFPTEVRTPEQLGVLADAMRTRLDDALRAVPALDAYADNLRAAFEAVRALGGDPIQRVHGDLHLGQTLRTVRGWKLVDFEGEPAKPLAERLLPDSVWRDVAGMLRSFDYAAAAVDRAMTESDADGVEQRAYRAHEWTQRNSNALLEAYTGGRALSADERVLLTAYEADKAVYECVYEVRNRPSWLGIPLGAVERLAS